MSVATLLAQSTHESIIPVRRPALATGDSTANAILALDLGQKSGWAARNADGAITSGTAEFKPGRFEGGGMVFLRFRAWLQEVDETAGGIGAVYFEEVRFHRGVAAAHAYGGFLAHLTGWAEANKIPYRGRSRPWAGPGASSRPTTSITRSARSRSRIRAAAG